MSIWCFYVALRYTSILKNRIGKSTPDKRYFRSQSEKLTALSKIPIYQGGHWSLKSFNVFLNVFCNMRVFSSLVLEMLGLIFIVV